MRRLVTLFSAATLSILGGVVVTSAVASGATDSTLPGSTEPHPLIGTWVTEAADPEHPFVLAFSADGNAVSLEEGDVSLGVWEATSPTSGALTITEQMPPDEVGGVEGATLTIRRRSRSPRRGRASVPNTPSRRAAWTGCRQASTAPAL